MKGRYRDFIEFLVISTLFTAGFTVSVCLVTFYLTDHPVILSLLLAVFSAALLIYTMNRYTDRNEDIINNPRRFRYLDRYGKATLTIATGLYLLTLIILLRHKPVMFLVAILPVIIAVLYSVLRLKRIFILKNVSVSLGVLCAVLIVLVAYDDFTLFSLGLIVFFFLGFLINTIIFDVKDVEGDVRYHIHTLPARYGLKNTKIACYALLLVMFLLLPVLISLNPRSVLLFPYALYIGVYITFAGNPRDLPPWYYGIFVDGESLFLCICCGIALALKMLW